ncbi:MAG TPA: hypothetical protein VMT61_08890 [Candidatus Binataceae bacterium]|nr:hypothetical protein [Candidatus Binataceae bacterium]
MIEHHRRATIENNDLAARKACLDLPTEQISDCLAQAKAANDQAVADELKFEHHVEVTREVVGGLAGGLSQGAQSFAQSRQNVIDTQQRLDESFNSSGGMRIDPPPPPDLPTFNGGRPVQVGDPVPDRPGWVHGPNNTEVPLPPEPAPVGTFGQ